jgi:Ca-activated chloride channel family protein
VSEVDKIAAEVAKDIRNQYTIAYRPPSNISTEPYRTIAVEPSSAGHGNLQVRTRKGYLRASSPGADR